MGFQIEVRGHRLHDPGEHEPGPEMKVKRVGGGVLEFSSRDQAEAWIDARLQARAEAEAEEPKRIHKVKISKEDYKILEV